MTTKRRLRIQLLTARLYGGSAWFHCRGSVTLATGWAPMQPAQ